MIYKPRKIPYVTAIKFDEYVEGDQTLEMLGIESPPPLKGFCECGRHVSKHGFYQNRLFCPGVYILYEGRTITSVMSIENFESIYVPLFDEEDVIGEVDAKDKKRSRKNKK